MINKLIGLLCLCIQVLLLISSLDAVEEWIDDPSLMHAPLQGSMRGEHYRYYLDMNQDGIKDLIYSYDLGLFGNGGGLPSLPWK